MPEPRRRYIAANWKMNKTIEEAEEFLDGLLERPGDTDDGVDVVVCPPYLALAASVDACDGSAVRIAAQNMHEEESGAFTGEVSAAMLRDVGAGAVVLGHSERRTLFGETDEALARKVPAALDASLEPILCVGESEGQRDAGETEDVLRLQLSSDLANVGDTDLARLVIAYEPVWAIGTGRTATPEQAQEACAFIRSLVELRSAEAAEAVRILYGGSVKPANAAELLGLPDIDGALVGGASLAVGDFAGIIEAATR